MDLLPDAIKIPAIIDKKSSRGFILYGEDNTLPNYLYNTYLTCSDLQTLINRTSDYVCGNQITSSYNRLSSEDESFEEVLRKLIFDYILFGGFAAECIRNKSGEIVRINYINFMCVRIDEDLTTAYLSNKWCSWSGKNMVQLPLYDKNQTQDHFIYYYRGVLTRNIYPVPIWFAGLKSAQVLNETRNYNLRNIQNNFSANVVVSMTGSELTDDELQEIKDGINAQYSGSDNAGKTVLINNMNADAKTEITRLDSDNSADLYKNLQESSQADLQMAFAMNPILIGVNVQTGFSKTEFAQAYALFQATVIKPLRRNIQKAFSKLDIQIDFTDFKIDWQDE